MYKELVAVSKEDAEFLIQEINALRENQNYQEAIELLTKLILIKEFSCIIFCNRIYPALYQELAELYELTNAPVSEIITLERYFVLYMSLEKPVQELRESLINLYVYVSEREKHPIPQAIQELLSKFKVTV